MAKCVILIFVLLGDLAMAGLTAPTDVETTGTLPKGIISPRYRQYVTTINERFGENGTVAPVAQAINQKISWGQVLTNLNQPEDAYMKSKLDASLKAMGYNTKTGLAGAISADVKVGVDIKTPLIGYGINDTTSVALIVPVYTVNTSVASSFVASAESMNWYNSQTSAQAKQAFKQQLEGVLTSTLNSMGYDPLASEEFTAIGDIYFVLKQQIYEDERHSVLWKNYIIAPTGIAPNPDKIVDVPTGDGQWDYQTGFVYQFDSIIPASTIPISYALNATYQYQVADHIEKRIPVEEGSILSPNKENVRRKLGDVIWLGGGLEVGKSGDGSVFGVSYDYQYAYANQYAGTAFDRQNYNWLENLEGDSEMTSATFKYSYSTIGAFRRKKFKVPATFLLTYGMPISGRNANKSDIYYGEAIFYF